MHIDFSREDRHRWAGTGMHAGALADHKSVGNLDSSHYPAYEHRNAVRREEEPESSFAGALRLIGQTFVPALTLIAVILVTFSLAQQNFPELAAVFPAIGISTPEASWLNWSTVGVALGFFTIQLTSRRYGLDIALAQIVSAWVLAGSALIAWPEIMAGPGAPMAGRTMLALAIALLVAHSAVAVVFDGARCFRWWQAPMVSGLWGSLVFVLLFYPIALAGTGEQWLELLLVQFAVLFSAMLVLLVPYWLFRPLIRPRAGYSGY